MLFQRLYNWTKYKILPPSVLFKNRFFVERGSKHKRIFTNYGLVFRNFKWTNHETYNIKNQFRFSFYKFIWLFGIVFFILFFLFNIKIYYFNIYSFNFDLIIFFLTNIIHFLNKNFFLVFIFYLLFIFLISNIFLNFYNRKKKAKRFVFIWIWLFFPFSELDYFDVKDSWDEKLKQIIYILVIWTFNIALKKLYKNNSFKNIQRNSIICILRILLLFIFLVIVFPIPTLFFCIHIRDYLNFLFYFNFQSLERFNYLQTYWNSPNYSNVSINKFNIPESVEILKGNGNSTFRKPSYQNFDDLRSNGNSSSGGNNPNNGNNGNNVNALNDDFDQKNKNNKPAQTRSTCLNIYYCCYNTAYRDDYETSLSILSNHSQQITNLYSNLPNKCFHGKDVNNGENIVQAVLRMSSKNTVRSSITQFEFIDDRQHAYDITNILRQRPHLDASLPPVHVNAFNLLGQIFTLEKKNSNYFFEPVFELFSDLLIEWRFKYHSEDFNENNEDLKPLKFSYELTKGLNDNVANLVDSNKNFVKITVEILSLQENEEVKEDFVDLKILNNFIPVYVKTINLPLNTTENQQIFDTLSQCFFRNEKSQLFKLHYCSEAQGYSLINKGKNSADAVSTKVIRNITKTDLIDKFNL